MKDENLKILIYLNYSHKKKLEFTFSFDLKIEMIFLCRRLRASIFFSFLLNL